jgi:ribose 5-phosphate isomerase A
VTDAAAAGSADGLKRAAGEHAASLVQSGMVVGLGTGSTAVFATRRIGELIASGALSDVVGIPTSRATEAEARRVGIPLMPDAMPRDVDLTIDGADEVSPALDLIKGGGGALLREKIVAQASRRVVIVVDESKISPALGMRHALPVEVARFGVESLERFIRSLGGRPMLRKTESGGVYETDQGNWILDCVFSPILEPRPLAERLSERAGVVEHGLFCGLASEVVIAAASGVRVMVRSRATRQ